MIDISRSQQITGWMSDDELRWLAETAQKSQRIIEIGSWKGRSTSALAAHCSGTVWAVDTWKGSTIVPEAWTTKEVELRGSEAIYEEFLSNMSEWLIVEKVKILRMDSGEAAIRLLREFGPRVFDFVFIDGEHEYEAAEKDIRLYLPLVKSGGLISGHDYGWEGVGRAVKERLPQCKYPGPAGSIWAVTI